MNACMSSCTHMHAYSTPPPPPSQKKKRKLNIQKILVINVSKVAKMAFMFPLHLEHKVDVLWGFFCSVISPYFLKK